MGLDVPATEHPQAATAAGRIALEACRVGLDVGAMRTLSEVSVTCDLIDNVCFDDLTIADLHRYACVLTASGQHDTILKLIERRYATLLMPWQDSEREREAATVLARLWMEGIQEQVGARYHNDILYKPETVGRALLKMERTEAAR